MTENQPKGSLKFSKEERLHHRSLVEGLFRTGKSFYEFPFRVSWRILSPEELQNNFRMNVPDGIGKLQVMITVPKKKRKKAVDRVLLRRRIKEAYRLNRNSFKETIVSNDNIGTFSVSLIYIHDQNLPFAIIEEKIKLLLPKLLQRVPARQDH